MIFQGYAIVQLPEMSYSLYQFLKLRNSRHVVLPSNNSNCMNATSIEVNGFDSRYVNNQFQYNKKDKLDLNHDQDYQLIDSRMESLRNEMKMELANMHESYKKDLLKEIQKLLIREIKK